jgi:polysaccharide deacetylase family protein (PEP-CTERM system associated)
MNVLTFDIEDWFHILDNDSTRSIESWANYEQRIHRNADRILGLLEAKKQRATFFCLGWVGEKYPDVIRRIHAAGHEIGSHSFAHQLVYEQTPQAYKSDFLRSIHVLEDITGERIRAYRAPGFSLRYQDKWVFDILLEHGIEIDCSIFPASRAHGGFENFGTAEPVWIERNGASLKEFPINVANVLGRSLVFSGGGYFRLLPYGMLRYLMGSSSYVMTYFHPRDFDPEQPMLGDLTLYRKFKSYYGLKGAYRKLECLLDEFAFVDLAAADKLMNWEQARRVRM